MCLHNYRVASRQRRRGITSGDGKRQREIACAEYHNRPERPQHGTNIRLGCGLAVRIAVVNSSVDPRSFFSDLREQAKLAAGACDFALQASLRQGCFLGSTLNYIVGDRFNVSRDGSQECAPVTSGNVAVDSERFVRQAYCKIHFLSRCGDKAGLQPLARGRICRI